jgi:hypothetical protein
VLPNIRTALRVERRPACLAGLQDRRTRWRLPPQTSAANWRPEAGNQASHRAADRPVLAARLVRWLRRLSVYLVATTEHRYTSSVSTSVISGLGPAAAASI